MATVPLPVFLLSATNLCFEEADGSKSTNHSSGHMLDLNNVKDLTSEPSTQLPSCKHICFSRATAHSIFASTSNMVLEVLQQRPEPTH